MANYTAKSFDFSSKVDNMGIIYIMSKGTIYELAYLISGELDELKAQDFAKKIENMVSGFSKNTIFSEPKKIRLAFPIKKQGEGFLVSIDFNAEPNNILQTAKELEKEKEVLRFLFVKKRTIEPEKIQVRPQTVKPEIKEKEEIKEKVKKEASKKEKIETADKKEGLKKIEEDLDKILGIPDKNEPKAKFE